MKVEERKRYQRTTPGTGSCPDSIMAAVGEEVVMVKFTIDQTASVLRTTTSSRWEGVRACRSFETDSSFVPAP